MNLKVLMQDQFFSIFGYNEVEGLRLRLGGRTYFGQNDPWRIEGFGAYGFKDQKFKYGLSGKVLVSKKKQKDIIWWIPKRY